MKSISRFLILTIIASLFALPTQAKDYDYTFDYGALINATVGKNFGKRFNVQVAADVWLNDNFCGYERAMASATFTYTLIPKYLKAMAYYAYFNQEDDGGKKDIHNHRYQVGLVGSYSTAHLDFSLTSKFEQTQKFDHCKGSRTPNNKWRTQIKVGGIISPKVPWRPFVSMEIFESMNGMNHNSNPSGIERIRYEAGTNYVISKLVSLEMKLRGERLELKSQLYSSIGVGVKFNL
ncbi:MAG: DUF2490 domain-containing protein [Porphyromonadaceae bacterium]|nr:DUF2490 domain-containing protein [Porphyromonadaceae bacterium]